MSKRKVAVIGAGLGGISAAVSLASAGYTVDVFEKNSHIGGKLNLSLQDGFSFDLGPSILTMPYLFRRLFEMSGRQMDDYVKITHVHPHWRCFFPDNTVRELDTEVFYQDGIGQFSHDSLRDLRSFLAYSQRLYDFADVGYFERASDSLLELVRRTRPFQLLRDSDFAHTVDAGVCRYTDDPYLQEILRFFIKYVGSSPYDAPAILNLLPHVQFAMGVWYVDGGMYNLARGLQRLMEELGIQIHLDAEVTAVDTEGHRVTGVRCADGQEAAADWVVSNMEFLPAYQRLLGVSDSELRTDTERFEPACSGLALHLGIEGHYEQLAHHNVFFSGDSRRFYQEIFHEKRLPSDPSIYLVAPTVTDPSTAPSGCSVIKVLPHIPHLADTPPTQEDYAQLRERVLVKLEGMGLGDLRERILVEETWTPVDIHNAYYSNRGAIYGVVSERSRNLGFKGAKRSRRFRGLYFVGGSVNPGPGMPMVVLSGQQVSRLIQQDAGGDRR